MPNLRRMFLLSALVLAAALPAQSRGISLPAEQRLPQPSAHGSYVVAISAGTARDGAWLDVAGILSRNHQGQIVIVPDGDLTALLPTLRRLRPRYVAFVATAEEAGRPYVLQIHRLLRKLDDDPYGDAIWGIVTGYEAADARRQAETVEPLTVASGFSSMGPGLAERFGKGFASSETDAHAFWQVADGKTAKLEVAPDPTEQLAKAFAETPPHLMHTSGHATEKDWQIGFTVKAGQIRCDNGQLFTLGVDGKRRDFSSPGTKIYMPMGNCLIGHVSGRDCMVTAWLHSGGVAQMYGYTVVTFFGYLGWGVNTYFGDGSLNLAQSFHANCQSLLHQLWTRFPHLATVELDDFAPDRINRTAWLLGIKDKDLLGLLWDRDTVAFYGDPAWEARMPASPRLWSASLAWGEPGNNGKMVCTVEITAEKAGNWPNRPLFIPLAERLTDISEVACSQAVQAVVTDDFIMLPLTGECAAGDTVKVTFSAGRRSDVATSSQSPPLNLAVFTAGEQEIIAAIPEELRAKTASALIRAGESRGRLFEAMAETPAERRKAMAFTLANMSDTDLQNISAELLKTHVGLAWEAWQTAPWRELIDESLFLDAVLPYASLDETRELWIPQMREKCLPMVADYQTPGAAGIALNRKIFDEFNVHYHATKRPKPNQAPSESLEVGYASCTGLAILLVNACRSVGVPARIVGVPRWTGMQGNHTWVEIWEDGVWHPVGASESTDLGQVWFAEAAAKADPRHPFTRIYATCHTRGDTHFPLVWNLGNSEAPAVDVTAAYRKNTEKSDD